MERLLMYICVAGLVLTIATMATMWLYAHAVRPLFTRMARLGHTSPMSLLVAIAIAAGGLEVAATKAPTNAPLGSFPEWHFISRTFREPVFAGNEPTFFLTQMLSFGVK